MNKCDSCPVNGKCIAETMNHAPYCEWARFGGIYRNQVIMLSNEEVNIQESNVVISSGNGGMTRIPVAESIQLNKEMKSCQYYERNSNCGCGRAKCKAGKGQPDTRFNDGSGLVSTWDCFHCLRPDVELYAKNAFRRTSS